MSSSHLLHVDVKTEPASPSPPSSSNKPPPGGPSHHGSIGHHPTPSQFLSLPGPHPGPELHRSATAGPFTTGLGPPGSEFPPLDPNRFPSSHARLLGAYNPSGSPHHPPPPHSGAFGPPDVAYQQRFQRQADELFRRHLGGPADGRFQFMNPVAATAAAYLSGAAVASGGRFVDPVPPPPGPPGTDCVARFQAASSESTGASNGPLGAAPGLYGGAGTGGTAPPPGNGGPVTTAECHRSSFDLYTMSKRPRLTTEDWLC